MSAHVEQPLSQWRTIASPVPSARSTERIGEEAPTAKGRRLMGGWSSEERNFAIGSVIVAGVIPGAAAIVIALANSAFGSGITP